MVVTLAGPTTVTIKPAVTATISTITILSEIDLSSQKKMVVNTKELGQVILWEGATYDAIGQWTDTDVTNRLLQLYHP